MQWIIKNNWLWAAKAWRTFSRYWIKKEQNRNTLNQIQSEMLTFTRKTFPLVIKTQRITRIEITRYGSK